MAAIKPLNYSFVRLLKDGTLQILAGANMADVRSVDDPEENGYVQKTVYILFEDCLYKISGESTTEWQVICDNPQCLMEAYILKDYPDVFEPEDDMYEHTHY